MEYCSHRFVSVNFDGRLRYAIAAFKAAIIANPSPVSVAQRDNTMVIAAKFELRVADYNFRPAALESFPLYFCYGCVCGASTIERPIHGLESP